MAERVLSLLGRALSAAAASTSSLLISFLLIMGVGIFGNPQAWGELLRTLLYMLPVVAGLTIVVVVIYYTRDSRLKRDALVKWLSDLWDAVRNSRFLTILTLVGASVLMSLLNFQFWPSIVKGITNVIQAGLQLVLFAFIIWLGFQVLLKKPAPKKKK